MLSYNWYDMTNEELLEDLKQYVSATVGQSETRLIERIDKLEARVEDGFNGVGEAINQVIDHIDAVAGQLGKRLDEHDHRLGRLEEHAA